MRERGRTSRRLARTVAAATLALASATLSSGGAGSNVRQPVYVGARVCASCHEGEGMGHQHSRWLLSEHSRAYADLALPEARLMAELSGIPGEPQHAPVCLGCHATATNTDAWERDPTFFIEDGVQCERCHGPGSEYIAEEVMRDPAEARRRGLRVPTRDLCARCHYVKGSHAKVHGKPPLDIDEALASIHHPTPAGGVPGRLPEPRPGSSGTGAAYAGVHACVPCHDGPEHGQIFSHWRLSGHARAYARLATPRARELARTEGVDGDPQRAPRCLSCHATGSEPGAGHEPSFALDEGVGCEACHGPAGRHVDAVDTADKAGPALRKVDEAACRGCHDGAHGRPFDHETALAAIAHPATPVESATGPVYRTPVNLTLSPDGDELWVACEAAGLVVVVDVAAREKVAELAVGRQPHDVAFHPDGTRAYVSNRLDDTVSVIDVETREVVATVAVGDDPHGLLTDAEGRRLYVVNTAQDSISVIDTGTLTESKRLAAGRNPWSLALSPDGDRILVTHILSSHRAFREPPAAEVTVIDTEDAQVADRVVLSGTNLLQGVSWHPSGDFALVTLNRTKNLVPMTRVLQGWTVTNGLGIVWRDGRSDQVLLDEPNLYFPDVADVTFTPDGTRALVTSSGSDRVAVVDIPRLVNLVESSTPEERASILPNHLGTAPQVVTAYMKTGRSPRGVTVSRDGRTGFAVDAMDDTLTVMDLEALATAARVDLGGPETITLARRGERLFHSADIAFQRQFSCHTCHPDGHVDGITYDIEPDGIGMNPVDNRTLRGILDTDPFKWTGKNKTLTRQCGPRLAVFFTRIEPFTPDELEALERYIATIPRPPNRHRPPGAELTPAQRRGKALFERAVTNDGRPIPDDQRCATCHFPPLFTNRSQQNVGTEMWLDTQGTFDVPHLLNIYASAPYLHNGVAATLEEIWTRYNPDDRHGVTNDMTKDQLNDLIEYLKTF